MSHWSQLIVDVHALHICPGWRHLKHKFWFFVNFRRSVAPSSRNMGHSSNLCAASHRGQCPGAVFGAGADAPSFLAAALIDVVDTFALATGLFWLVPSLYLDIISEIMCSSST